MGGIRHILATDLDRTLLPNGPWPADQRAIPLFNRLTAARSDLQLVYVTGRSLALTERAIAEYGIRPPDVLCGDVGTTLRHFHQGTWRDDPGWAAAIQRACPDWDAAGLEAALAHLDGLRLQEREHLNAFKLSFYVEHERRDAVLAAVQDVLPGGPSVSVVYSVDPLSGRGLLDLLPGSANKRAALEYTADRAGLPAASVIFCGDSGNDLLPLTGEFRGVVVRNADAQLTAALACARREREDLQLYFARGGPGGMNGNYASGVLEGCCHYGLFEASQLD